MGMTGMRSAGLGWPSCVLSRSCIRRSFLVLAIACALAQERTITAAPFVRGDVDTNGNLDLTDGVRVLGFLFLGSPAELPCLDAADANDSGTHDLTDGIYILNYLFVGGAAPPAPFPDCGEDLTPDAFDCALFAPCPIVKGPMVP